MGGRTQVRDGRSCSSHDVVGPGEANLWFGRRARRLRKETIGTCDALTRTTPNGTEGGMSARRFDMGSNSILGKDRNVAFLSYTPPS